MIKQAVQQRLHHALLPALRLAAQPLLLHLLTVVVVVVLTTWMTIFRFNKQFIFS
jgi:hypothetical protein